MKDRGEYEETIHAIATFQLSGARGVIQAHGAHGFIGPGGVALPQRLVGGGWATGAWDVWDVYDPRELFRAPRRLVSYLDEAEAMCIAFDIA